MLTMLEVKNCLFQTAQSWSTRWSHIVEALIKFEPSLPSSTAQTAPAELQGTQESFVTRPKYPAPSSPHQKSMQTDLDALRALIQDDIVDFDAAQKSPKLHYNSEQNVINLPAIVGCLNWIALRIRPDIAWATSRAASLITHDPDTCFTRVEHICQYLPVMITPWDMLAICSNTQRPADQAQAMGRGRCLLCTDRGEESTRTKIVYHGITSENKNGGNLVQWRSSRQDLIAKSACEADLIASSEALQQGENIAIVVAEMTNRSCEIEVSSDNAASLHMIRNGSETAWRTRHISVKALWMHQMARRGIKFTCKSTAEMAADSLTKGLGASRLPQIREDLKLIEE